jgi:YgiT-type zinc finger domain-containing protein
MICLICRQTETIDGLTIVKLERGEFRLVVNSVPARICPGCGEAYVEEAVAVQLLEIAAQTSETGVLDAQYTYGALYF